MNIEQKRVTVYASNSDLFTLLLMHYSSFNCHALHMKSYTGYTSITAVHEFLGPVVAKALLSFHALTGCDTTDKFSGKSKEFWTKMFVQERNNVSFIGALNALQDTGPSENVVSKLARFICRAYCTNRITNDIAETRYFLYKKISSETNKLPPTAASLQHVLRAFCQIGVWKSAHLSIIDIPILIENGWEVSDGGIMEDLIELVSCNCKGNCATKRCKCHKSDEASDFCGCSDECVNSDMALPENVLERK